MSGVMAPEPPPLNGEADYFKSPTKPQAVATMTSGASQIAFYGTDLPIPAHILTRTTTPELNKAVAEVLQESDESIPKRGYNDFHKYWYATADDIRMHVATKIGKYGLSYEQHEVGYTPFDKLIAVHYYFVLCHASGETSPPQRVTALALMVSNNGKPDDKAFSKASVLALKDWAKSRFSIATGDMADDPDADQPPAPQQRPAAAPQRPVAVKSPAAKEAFRNAGLPPKVKPTTPHVAETGEVEDSWLPNVLRALETLKREAWLAALVKATAECPSIDAARMIESAPSVIHWKKEAKPDTVSKITTAIREMHQRLLEQLIPMDPPTDETKVEDDGWPGPTPESIEAQRTACA